MAKVYEIAIAIAGKINSSFGSAFMSASEQMGQLNQRVSFLKTELKGLEKAQKQATKEAETSASAHLKLKGNYSQSLQTLLQLNQKITSTKDALKALSEQKKAGTISAKEYSTKQAELVNQLSKANDAYAKLKPKVQSMKSEMQRLSEVEQQSKLRVEQNARTYDELARKLEKAERAQRRYSKAVELQDKVGKFRDQSRARMVDAVAMGATLAVPVTAAVKFESDMADVRKVVDFDTPEQFKEMEQDILNLSKRIPMAVGGLAQIVAAGGQSGIAKEDLVEYAEAAAKMGVAFDITAEEAGETMAKWRAAFKMDQGQVNILADQINHLGNTTAASAPKIADVVRRIGPLGEVGGAAAAEISALGASMIGAGVESEVAATGIKNMILGLVAGESATDKQTEAFKSLGLDALEMAKYMQEDAQGAIIKVLKALRELPEYEQAAKMQQLFGKESLGAISPLLTNLEALVKNFGLVGDETQYAGSMQAEFDARAATTENSLQLLKNQANALAITMGKELLPSINSLAEKFSRVAERVTAFAEKHPALTGNIVKVTAAVLGGIVALSALGYIVGIILSPFASFYSWIVRLTAAKNVNAIAAGRATLAQRAWNVATLIGRGIISGVQWVAHGARLLAVAVVTKAVTAAQWLWNVAMMANPIGLIIAGIAALIGVGVLLVKNWEWITEKWKKLKALFSKDNAGLDAEIDISTNVNLDANMEAIQQQVEAHDINIPANLEAASDQVEQIQQQVGSVDIPAELNVNAELNVDTEQIAQLEKQMEDTGTTSAQKLAESFGSPSSTMLMSGSATKINDAAMSSLPQPETLNQYGQKLGQSLADGLLAKESQVREASQRLAAAIKDNVGFSSPTREGPGATADRWAPNLVTMFTSGLSSGVEKVATESRIFVASIVKQIPGRAAEIKVKTTPRAATIPITAHAKGGVFNSPHLGMVAEAGYPEAIIPIVPGRQESIMLLNQTANMLGAATHAEGGVFNSPHLARGGGLRDTLLEFRTVTQNSSNESITINAPFKPTINTGNGNVETIQEAIKKAQEDHIDKLRDLVRDVLRRERHNERRVAYVPS